MNIIKLGLGDLVTDVWGVQKVSFPVSLFHGIWTYDIPSSMWFMYENGVQVYTSSNIKSVGGVAQLTADATKHTVLMESRECPRYQPNRGHLFSTALWFPNPTADATRDFGLFTSENGVFFRLKSDGKLYAVIRRAGVEVLEEYINTTGIDGFDISKNNIYDIQFQWRSAGNYIFYVGNPKEGVSRVAHKINFLGTLTSASIENPALPAAYKVTRGTEDAIMNVGCADITTENGMLNNNEQYNSTYAENIAVATNTPVLTIRQPLTISYNTVAVTNTRTVTLTRISVSCSKKAVFKVWMTRDATAFTGTSYVNLHNGSFVQTDTASFGGTKATAVDTAKLNFITAIPVEAAVPREVTNPHMNKIVFPVVRGDYLVVTCTAATATADCVIEIGEEI